MKKIPIFYKNFSKNALHELMKIKKEIKLAPGDFIFSVNFFIYIYTI